VADRGAPVGGPLRLDRAGRAAGGPRTGRRGGSRRHPECASRGLADLVAENGGDVLKLTGDGLFALWPDEHEASAVARAVACALAAEQRIRDVPGGPLSFRWGIGAGRVRTIAVAWDGDHRDLVVTGPAVADTCRAERQAGPGEILLTEHAWTAAASDCVGEPRPDGWARVTDLRRRPPARGAVLDPPTPEAIHRWVPPAIRARLAAGQEEWLAEHRRVTVLFVQLPDWGNVSTADAQATIDAVANVLTRCDGS
jgi:hypothetical protein